jgi:hypothetical protein
MNDQLILFDYGQLDTETKIVVQQRTGEIKDLVRATAENIARIGGKLVEVRARLGNGGRFDAWLQTEFEWSRRTAYNFIAVHDQFGDRANFAQLDIATSALYLLAAPSTPAEARDEALARAEAGERISHATAKEITAAHQPPPPPRLPEPEIIRLDNPPPAPWEESAPAREDVPAPRPYAPQHSTAATFEQVAPPPPTLAPRPAPVVEPEEEEFPAARPLPPPPAPAAPTLPPPPPPAINAGLLHISLTVRASGALLSAKHGEQVLAMENVANAAAGQRVQALIAQIFGGADDDPNWLQ